MPYSPIIGGLYSQAGLRKYLTASERQRFLDATYACPRIALRTFCLMLAFSGCRISEALAVVTTSVERDEKFVAVRSLKKRTRFIIIREIPLAEDFVGLLADVHQLNDASLSKRLWPWSRSRAWQLVKGIMADAGIEGIQATPKGLRHGFGLHAIRSGCPINLVQRWLGHARMETTAIYLQAVGIEERELAARMWPPIPERVRQTSCQ